MDINGKRVVITGAAGGIGRAMAVSFKNAGAEQIICTDILEEGSQLTADMVGGESLVSDISTCEGNEQLINTIEDVFGPIDIFCANAGISAGGDIETDNKTWQRVMNINTMSHVWVSRHLIPKMEQRGSGYIVYTASAAGLLSQIGSITYTVSKAAAVAHAEFVSIAHGPNGIGVSVLCPQAVRTNMTAGIEGGGVAGVDGMLEPEIVGECVVDCVKREEFLVLPHEEVLTYMKRKAEDRTRWIKGMQNLRSKYIAMHEQAARNK